ncbi:TPA: hypothetical protein QCP92_002661 [Bacillus cereus]|nr:hypothetical protein [Bacillus cereus]
MDIKYVGSSDINFTNGNFYKIIDVVDSFYKIVDDFEETYLYDISNNAWEYEESILKEYLHIFEHNLAMEELAASTAYRQDIYMDKDVVVKHDKFQDDLLLSEDIEISDTNVFIKKGTFIKGVRIIAAGKEIREVNHLMETYKLQNGMKTKEEDWLKMRGTALITDNKEYHRKAEVHWYQAKNIGKVKFKTTNIL